MSQAYNVTLHRLGASSADKSKPSLYTGTVTVEAESPEDARTAALAKASSPVAGTTTSQVSWDEQTGKTISTDNGSLTWVGATQAQGPKAGTLMAGPYTLDRHGRSPIRRGVDSLPAKTMLGAKPVPTSLVGTLGAMPGTEQPSDAAKITDEQIGAEAQGTQVAPAANKQTPPASVPSSL